jgi:hypothetical protein
MVELDRHSPIRLQTLAIRNCTLLLVRDSLVGVEADGITFIPDLHTSMSSRFIYILSYHLFLGLPNFPPGFHIQNI